jgi:hypothetical protein
MTSAGKKPVFEQERSSPAPGQGEAEISNSVVCILDFI